MPKVISFKLIPLFCLFLLIFSLSACQQYSGKTPPKAVKGVLDLRDWDFEKDGPIRLNGEWELYWEKLLEGNEEGIGTTIEQDGFYTMPRGISWRGHTLPDGRVLSHIGYGTFRLKVLLLETQNPILHPELNFYSLWPIRGHSAAQFQVWDQNSVAISPKFQSGVTGEDSQSSVPSWKKGMIPLNGASELKLNWQISNFHRSWGGPSTTPQLGNFDQIDKSRLGKTARDFFIIGLLFIIGVYHLILFSLHPKDQAPLWLGIVCLQIAGMTLILGVYLGHLYTDPFLFQIEQKTLFCLFFYLAIPSFALFLKHLFPKQFSPIFVRFIVGFGCLWAGLGAILPFHWMARKYLYLSFHILLLPPMGYVLYVIFKAQKSPKKRLAQIMGTGLTLLFITVMYDIGMVLELIPRSFYWHPFGLCLFILFQAIAIAVNNQQNYLEKIRTEKALVRSKEETFEAQQLAIENMQKASQLKDEFLANTSHELRTPLNGIIGLCESLLDGAHGYLNPPQASNMSMVVQSGKRLANLVNDILDFSKMKHQELSLKLKPVGLNSMVQLALKLSQPLIGHKKVTLQNQLSEDLPLVQADEDRLQQILLNLLGNAIKFTHEGTITLSAEIQEKEIKVSIADTGIGIAQDKLESIFESFEQADGTTAREYGGTGLGLSVTKQLVELQKGRIEVQSTEGQGWDDEYPGYPVSLN